MKYIVMCGGNYEAWETPRQLSVINGETLVERTIRLLRENGIKDINISSTNSIFEKFGVPVLKHDNKFTVGLNYKRTNGDWFDAFYPTDEPTCYLFGDVCFSPEAIKKIIETEVGDIELFASKKPFANNYFKKHEEPFALKVMNTNHLKEAIKKAREIDKENKFWREPMVWELYTVIKNAPLQTKKDQYTAEYTAINDYTCDIDKKDDIIELRKRMEEIKMVKCQVIETFTLERFNELKNIVRVREDKFGKLNIGDIFECTNELAGYLLGNNAKNKTVVKVLEVMPEILSQSPVNELEKSLKTKSKLTTTNYKKKKASK